MSFTFRPSRLYYRGVRFHTETAARWAQSFDLMGVRFEHERHQLGTQPGRPVDVFYLPPSRQHAVVIPTMTALDRVAVVRWTASRPARFPRDDYDDFPVPDLPIITLGEGGHFLGWNRDRCRGFSPDAVEPEGNVELCRCIVCGGWMFLAACHSWACVCCGHYDGNADIHPMLESPLTGWPTPPRYAQDEEVA